MLRSSVTERPPSISVFLLSRTEIRYSNSVKIEWSQRFQHRYASIFTVDTQKKLHRWNNNAIVTVVTSTTNLRRRGASFQSDSSTAVVMFACLCEWSRYLCRMLRERAESNK